MKLEKANETVWSIKRKENEGKFILRSSETGGIITRVAIALEKGEDYIEFEMNPMEFQNFFGIFTSFKELIERPQLSKEYQSPSINHMISEKISTNAPTNAELSLNKSDEDEIEELIRNFASTELNKSNNQSNLPPNENKKPIENKTPAMNERSRKERLRETDWDPW